MIERNNVKTKHQALNGFAHLIILVIALVVGVGIFWFYSNNQITTEKYSSDLSSIPTASPEKIKDWETYVDPQHGLSFKHPTEWFVSESGSIFPVSLAITPDAYSTEILLDAPQQDGLYVNLSWAYDSNLRPKRRFKSITEAVNDQTAMMNKKSIVRNDFEVAGKKAVTIQGKTQTDNLWTNGNPVYTTYIQLDDDVLKLSLNGDYIETYNLILSTLDIPDNMLIDAVKVDRYCTQDSECWCYSFDGAVFNFDELLESYCNLERGRCIDCAYR